MTEREFNIIKEKYNELVQEGRRSFEAAEWIPAMRRVLRWLGIDFNTDANGFMSYIGYGKEYSDNEKQGGRGTKEKLISKSELLEKLEELKDRTRDSSRATTPNTPAMYNYDGRMTMLDIIIGLIEDWGEEEEPEKDIPADYFRPM